MLREKTGFSRQLHAWEPGGFAGGSRGRNHPPFRSLQPNHLFAATDPCAMPGGHLSLHLLVIQSFQQLLVASHHRIERAGLLDMAATGLPHLPTQLGLPQQLFHGSSKDRLLQLPLLPL